MKVEWLTFINSEHTSWCKFQFLSITVTCLDKNNDNKFRVSLTLMLCTEKLPLQRQNILSLPSALKCCSWISHHLIFLGHEIKECLVLQSLSIHLIASLAAEHYADHLIVTALILYWWQKHSPEDDCLRKNIRDHNVLGIMKDSVLHWKFVSLYK